MAQLSPIIVQEHLQLTNVNLTNILMSLDTVTMDSDKYICVCEKGIIGGVSTVKIIDLTKLTMTTVGPLAAQSVIMSPTKKVLALKTKDAKAQTTLQIFDTEKKTTTQVRMMPENVVFWRWISPSTVALVTKQAVYHWYIECGSAPIKMFNRDLSLTQFQITDYTTDLKQQYLLLIGTREQQIQSAGIMQLHSIKLKTSQLIEGHAASFVTFRLHGNTEPSTLLCFALKNAQGAKLHIHEVGRDPVVNQHHFKKKVLNVHFPQLNDYPFGVHVSRRYDVIYLITKLGYFHMYDVESGTRIYMNRLTTEALLVSVPQESSGGVICVNSTGKVLSVTVKEDAIVPFIVTKLENHGLGNRFAARIGPTAEAAGEDNHYLQLFADRPSDKTLKVENKPDYISMLQLMLCTKPAQSVTFARSLVTQEPPLVDIHQVVDMFNEMKMTEQLNELLVGLTVKRHGKCKTRLSRPVPDASQRMSLNVTTTPIVNTTPMLNTTSNINTTPIIDTLPILDTTPILNSAPSMSTFMHQNTSLLSPSCSSERRQISNVHGTGAIPKQRPQNQKKPKPNPIDNTYNCPTCKQMFTGNLFQCLNGHTSCAKCKQSNKVCGCCGYFITETRNFTLEELLAGLNLLQPCPNADCSWKFKRNDIMTHLKECFYRDMECPVTAVSKTCSWIGKQTEITEHFKVNHSEHICEPNTEMFLPNISSDNRFLYLVTIKSFHFLLHIKISVNNKLNICMGVQYVGPKINSQKWTYKLTIVDSKMKSNRKYVYSAICLPVNEPVEELFRVNDCAILPLSYALKFVDDGALSYKLSLQKVANHIEKGHHSGVTPLIDL